MIKYVSGDIFESDADCIINTVNCEGYMGKGVAYQYKQRFPKNNIKYVDCCKAGKLRPGILLPYVEKGRVIINFPTKDKWRQPSKMQYIIDGLDTFVRMIPDLKVKKVAIPPLGCGNGGLNWNDVKAVIDDKLGACNIDIEVFQPGENVSLTDRRETMTEYDLLLLHIRENLDKPSSLRFQKTIFFTNHYSGRELYRFTRGRYGPYSKDLYRNAEKIGRYQKRRGLSDTTDTYRAIYQLICSKKVDDRYRTLSVQADKALALVNAMDDDLILEGTATALYLIQSEQIIKRSDIFRAFHEWSDDKAARFSKAAIEKSLDKLEVLGIIQRNLFDEYQLVYI